MHDGIQITLYTTTIKAASIERDGFHCIFSGLCVDGICQLDFPTSARGLIAQDIKDVRGQDIAANTFAQNTKLKVLCEPTARFYTIFECVYRF